MESSSAWKSSLSAVERYEIITDLQNSLPSHLAGDAINIEQEAYQSASSKDEYLQTIKSATSQTDHAPSPSHQTSDEIGIRIGPYSNCTPISSGVTSEVYRSGNRALKVIVTHRNLEPHNPQREAKILASLRPPVISLVETFRDHEQRLVLVFPYMPLTLADLLEKEDGALTETQVRAIFTDTLQGLESIHAQGIIHRDIKPSAVLLESSSGPARLADFGTAWHPQLSIHSEPETNKILDIGTGPYRAPEVLFGNKAYGTAVDMWSLGVMLAEAINVPPKAPFESRPAHEDGSQLGLILSIFKTMGTPDADIWPEAKNFKVSPFELWTVFPQRSWDDILPGVHHRYKDLVAGLVRFESADRLSAAKALEGTYFRDS